MTEIRRPDNMQRITTPELASAFIEEQIKALKEQKNKKSIILVSHRESTMAIADRIYRVERGRMYEQK